MFGRPDPLVDAAVVAVVEVPLPDEPEFPLEFEPVVFDVAAASTTTVPCMNG